MVDRELLEGHIDRISTISFSYDSRYLASGSYDKSIIIWDVKERRMVHAPCRGHDKKVISIVFSPDGENIASGTDDGSVCIWKVSTGVMVHQLKFSGSLSDISYSPNGLHITMVGYIPDNSDIGIIEMWDTLNIDEPPKHFEDSLACACDSISFAYDSARFVSSHTDGTIRIWNTAGGITGTNSLLGQKIIRSVAVSPSGRYVASGCEDGTICVWIVAKDDLVSGPCKGVTGEITSIAFSHDDRLIAAGSSSCSDGTVMIWSMIDEDTLPPIEVCTGPVTSIHFSPDGKHIASGSLHSTICIWLLKSGELAIEPLEGHSGNVLSIAYSPNGGKIVSGSKDGTTRIWNAINGHLISTLEGHFDSVDSVSN